MKILASDFDKTLFTKDYLRNIKKINEFVDNGNIFIIITGRNYTHLIKDIRGYNIKYSYLVCNDGGIIFDNEDNVIYRKDISPSIVDSVFKILSNDENISFVAVDNSKTYVDAPAIPANAILAKPYNIDKAEEVLKYILDEFPDIHGYISETWLNITNCVVNKGSGLKYIQEILNIADKDIFTIGDNINDVSMNKLYNGYSMRGSVPELIKVSKKEVDSVADLVDIINNN